MNVQVGKKMRLLRKQKGFSQEQVADYIHIAQSTYARIENGIGNSWANYVLPLCALFGVELEEFFKLEFTDLDKIKKSTKQSNEPNIINGLLDRLIDQYEKRILERDICITELKLEIERLKKLLSIKTK
ncbi:hypothetical protein CAPN010_05180 [Capnocytophaga cynodegmi]|uniref:helix-turn-helix transcriptional regulator n=1 Tax=Capnocytophaga cynodegmi TaxID=28189 RepID=UPI001EE1BACB|nr:helix-turn-helix transcriptional regulator [Capnocytophaga cynodegmi]GJQ06360.1 hypothetical protein CAPN010_05180 [Capnocytophaga cynodegmi]